LLGGATMLGILAGADELPQISLGNIDGVAGQSLAVPGLAGLVALHRRASFEFNRRVQAFYRIGDGQVASQH